MERTECYCGGRLWYPRSVGGKPGNQNIEEAARLIREGKEPWKPQ